MDDNNIGTINVVGKYKRGQTPTIRYEEKYGFPLIFEMPELDYDDPVLDIYSTSVEEMVAERKKKNS